MKTTVRNIQLIGDSQSQIMSYRIEYEVTGTGFVGRFLIPKVDVEDKGLDYWIKEDLSKVQDAITMLIELKEQYEGKSLNL